MDALAGIDLGELTARYVAAWNGCDTDAMAALVTDDVHWVDAALPAPLRGVSEVQAFMRQSFAAFPDLHFGEPDPPHVSASGHTIAWSWFMEGTLEGPLDPPGFAPTGRRMRVEGVDIWVMKGGLIADYRAFYDVADLARQLGIMPPHGSGAEKATVALQKLQARFQRR